MRPRPDGAGRIGLIIGAVLVAAGVALLGVGAVAWFTADEEEDAPAAAPVGALGDAIAAAEPATDDFPGLTEAQLAVGERCLRVVIADEVPERVQGLRGVEDLGPYDAMLFVFDGPSTSSFTMSGVLVPLDIGWYDEAGGPVDSAEMEPCPQADASCPPYPSTEPYRFALETLGGDFPAGALGACPS